MRIVAPRPTATVIIPSHRGAHRLPSLLRDLAGQEGGVPFDVVVVLDGILDESPQVLAQWDTKLTITTIRHEQAQGVAAALTTGFNAAEGDYLIRCDDDLSVPADFVVRHIARHAGAHDRLVLSLTRDAFVESAYARAYGRPASERGLAACYAQLPELRWQHVAACFSLHRSLWEASGGFDPSFAYGEDSEFGYRMWRSGATIIIDPTLEVTHLGPATSAAVRVPRSFVSGASRRRFAQVHPEASRGRHPRLSLTSHVWRVLVSTLAHTVRSRAGYAVVGRWVQRAVDRVPSPVGGKLIAWAVEAAVRSGERYGSVDLHSYRPQKDAELTHEQGGRPTAPRESIAQDESQLPATVVIAVHNGAATIGDQLAALAGQEDAPDFDVLVVDNRSTDDLVFACRPYQDQLNLRLVSAPDHPGQAYARNVGVLAARGRHVLFCDDDDIVAPTWVGAMTRALAAGGVLATGPLEVATLNSPEARQAFVGGDGTATSVISYPTQGYLATAWGGNLGVNREDYLAIGGMDNSYRGGDEDTDFSWRAQEHGLRLVVVDAAVLHVRLREDPRQLFRQRRGYARARMLTYARSVGTSRQLTGPSLKWSLTQLALLPGAWARSRNDKHAEFLFAQRAGSVIGNLEGQIRHRLLRQLPQPQTLHQMQDPRHATWPERP